MDVIKLLIQTGYYGTKGSKGDPGYKGFRGLSSFKIKVMVSVATLCNFKVKRA
jgi:hypothetical protein